METRHLSLQMTEVADVTDLLSAFETENNVCLEMRIGVNREKKVPSLGITVIAHDKFFRIGEVPPLASVSVICSDMNLKHMMGVVTHALYALDFQIALNEYETKAPKKA